MPTGIDFSAIQKAKDRLYKALTSKPPDEGQEATVRRTHGIGAQILRNLGIHRMRVLSAPKQMSAISGFGLEVVEYVD